MKLPFTTEQFFNVFQMYNLAVAPFEFLAYLLASTAIYLAFRKVPVPGKITLFILSFFWIWMGAVYHLAFFSTINKAANLFGAAFIVQGLLFLWAAFTRPISFRFHANVYGITGALLLIYALLLYPLLGNLAGHVYPAAPRFGLPCPTTIFTFAILLWTNGKCPLYLLIIPLLWSVIGFIAALALGVPEDTGLLVAGLASTTILLLRNRIYKSKTTGITERAA